MKKRILSILLILCMVLMLVPATAFADEGYYTITQNFKYGAHQRDGVKVETSPYTYEQPAIATVSLGTVIDCAPYKFVGWKETSSGMVYEPNASILPESNLTFEAVYEVDGSLAITVDGFEVGKTPADCTFSFESTIPGIEFSAADIAGISWRIFDGQSYHDLQDTDTFDADKTYNCYIRLSPKGLTSAPAATVNGNTPFYCDIQGLGPQWLCVYCNMGEPASTITIDGPDVVCAQQDYKFTATPPAGVTLDETFGHDTGFSGSDIVLTIDEDGVGHGVVPAAYYEPAASGFDVSAHGTTAGGTPVSTTKHVEVSPEHLYKDGVCGCGAVLQYEITYMDGGTGEGSIAAGVKIHGVDFTLSSETFTRDGYVQAGWIDEYGTEYDLGGAYTLDEDMMFYPVWHKVLTVPYATTVALDGCAAPGETVFALAIVGANADADSYADVTVSGSVTTNGAGSYNGTLTFTGPEWQLWNMLGAGAFVQQVDAGKAGWTVDDAVYGLYLWEIAAYSTADNAGFAVIVFPAVSDGAGNYTIDEEAEPLERMSFTNTYTAHAYELKHDATHHWDECECKDVQNKEAHKYGDWKVTKDATQTAKGEKEHTCTVCGYTEKAEIPQRTIVDTGDNSSFALWLALFTLSAAAVITTATVSKKKKANK